MPAVAFCSWRLVITMELRGPVRGPSDLCNQCVQGHRRHGSVVSLQLARAMHEAILLIIRRSWVRAPPAPPNLSCGDARLSASCNPVVGTLSGSEGRRKYARGHGAVFPASGSALPSARRQLVACLALAAELAADWGIVPFKLPGVADWSAMFAADPQRGQPPSDGSGPGPSSTVAGRSLTARTVASRLAIPSAEGTAHTLSAMGRKNRCASSFPACWPAAASDDTINVRRRSP
jgi:hypothetical protein